MPGNEKILTADGEDFNKDNFATSHDTASSSDVQAGMADSSSSSVGSSAPAVDEVVAISIVDADDELLDDVDLLADADDDAVDDDEIDFDDEFIDHDQLPEEDMPTLATKRMSKTMEAYLDAKARSSLIDLYPWVRDFKPTSMKGAWRRVTDEVVQRRLERGGEVDEVEFFSLAEEMMSLMNVVVNRHNSRVNIQRKLCQDKKLTDDEASMILKRWNQPSEVPVECIASVIYRVMTLRRFKIPGDAAASHGRIVRYHHSGPYEGTYRLVDDDAISGLVSSFGLSSTSDTALLKGLEGAVPQESVVETVDPNVVILNNGIWDISRKKLLPFTPDHVSLYKPRVSMPDHAPEEPRRLMPDGVERTVTEIMAQWVPYEGGTDLLYQVCAATLRSKFNFRKAVLLYNEHGKNGKSTFLEVLIALAGEGAADTSLEVMCDNRFGLTDLVGKSLACCGDSSPGTFIENTANFKQVVAHEKIRVESKGKDGWSYRPHVLIVMAGNTIPRFRGQEEAVFGRWVQIPFLSTFDGSACDPGLQAWLTSDEVLNWIAYHVLCEMPYFTKFKEPEEVKNLLEESRKDSDPVLDWWASFEKNSEVFYPFEYLYGEYLAWLDRSERNVKAVGSKTFNERIKLAVQTATDSEWTIEARDRTTRRLKQYEVGTWVNSATRVRDAKDPSVTHEISGRRSGPVRKDIVAAVEQAAQVSNAKELYRAFRRQGESWMETLNRVAELYTAKAAHVAGADGGSGDAG